ncbi:histidine protein kinase plnb [Companilactobacillus kimchiensis]|uniref:Histidine protein kinase plnb n=2 Tax=Companilactobacillus kimchiensis TaxID=993692 RepID=A0A0R2LCQ6_9LACO|nr:histidine protein kinase plnb [Companilactobacillus kimchiensis]
MGMLVYDFSYLFLLFYLIVFEMIKQRTIKFEKNELNPLMLMLILELIIFIFSGLIGKMLEYFFTKGILGMHYNNLMLILSLIINGLIVAILINIIKIKKNKIKNITSKVKSLNLGNRIFWMLFSLFLSFEIILFVSDIEGVTSFIKGTILVIFVSLLFFMIWQMADLIQSFANKQKMIDTFQQNKQLNDYLKSVQEQYDDLRKFKHDFKNIVLSMHMEPNDLVSKNYEQLYRELTQQKEFTSDLDGKIIVEYKKIVNEPLRGLVIQEFFKAKSSGINLNVEIADNYIQLDDDILNVVRIVGILLDNAIEETTVGVKKNIDLAFIKNDDVLEISIENPLNHSVDVRDIFKQGYSTKGNGHGTGLANVSELIDKDSNLYLDTEIISNKLRITLMILKGG